MKITRICQCCKKPFQARKADVKRGWAKYCSKRCKAIKQEQRTGQHHEFLRTRTEGLCFPSPAEGDVQ